MVRIAIAGPGGLAHEVIDGLVATGKHEIVILSRREATPEQAIEGTTWVKVDYQKDALVPVLRGVHTVLSFIVPHLDVDNAAQRALIDAAIEACVKRIAPSEWGPALLTHLAWYGGKLGIRKYLEEKNKDKKVIEYCLFQPGWYLNFLAGEHRTLKHIEPNPVFIDFENCRAFVAGSLDHPMSCTAVGDIVKIVARAVDYAGEWPTVGGINGTTFSVAELVALGEKLRGKPFKVDILDVKELKAGTAELPWIPENNYASLSHLEPAAKLGFIKHAFTGMLLNLAEDASVVSDEWNRIFPDYQFTSAEEFLTNIWAGKA